MPIMSGDELKARSSVYRDGYLDAIYSKRPNPPTMSREEYMKGYTEGSIDRDNTRKENNDVTHT